MDPPPASAALHSQKPRAQVQGVKMTAVYYSNHYYIDYNTVIKQIILVPIIFLPLYLREKTL